VAAARAVRTIENSTWEAWTPPAVTTAFAPKSWRPVEVYVASPPSVSRYVTLYSAPEVPSGGPSESDYEVWRDEALEIAVASFDAAAEAWPEQ